MSGMSGRETPDTEKAVDCDPVGSAGGASAARPEPTGARFLPPPPRTVHAVLPHTAHRRPSPPAFGFTRQGLRALGEATASTHARSATSLRWTLSKSAWNRRPGSALAAR